ncbi:hypothetical protein TNCV_3569701 [Trichonephila clavipes]|nr:hypothetical protein TNCV_3569701 [Trichonephila clavipes]
MVTSKDGTTTDESKIKAIIEMKPKKFQKSVEIPGIGIKHVKTVVYRPQSNRMERVNHDLLQMIASSINDNHKTWDEFLRDFAYALRTAVHETTG